MPACKSCGARVIWARTEKGRSMPVDYTPLADGGNIRLDHGADAPIAVYVSGPQSGPRYVSHFATCKFAASHRKVKSC